MTIRPRPGGAALPRCLLLALVLSGVASGVASGVRQEDAGALTVVENPEGGEGEEEATVEETEELEVFQPSEQWQTLRPGQMVPAGSHVRLNLQTGAREVKLGEEQLKYWTQAHGDKEDSGTAFSPDELKRAMKKIKEDLKLAGADPSHQDSGPARFRPLEELKRDMAELDLLVETDVQIMRRLLDQYNSSNATTEERLGILLELEYLVHQVDNAQTLCSMGGMEFILEALNSSDVRLQEASAFVLGSALSSNPAVQVRAAESGALQMLLTALASAQPIRVKKKVLFATASLLRHFPFAQKHFLSHGGMQVLSDLFRADESGILRTRIVTMLYDMISEKELTSGPSGPGRDPSQEERRRQYSEVSLRGGLLEKGWCGLVPQLLRSAEHDHREKALRALLAMAPVCLDRYRSDASLRDSLLTLRLQYQEIVRSETVLGEESGYFTEMVELIESLQVKLNDQSRVDTDPTRPL
ncbi:nucleotide exchange factor SIL1 isoform 2-T2 [Menidia menidia]